jgi:hypothetical protein
MAETSTRRPIFSWTALRFALINSNILAALLGVAVVLGLPEALLTADASCYPARVSVVRMGEAFAAQILLTLLTLVCYVALSPDTFKDYPDLASFVSWRGGDAAKLTQLWSEINQDHRAKRRRIVLSLGALSGLLFFVFLYFCLQFLERSLGCTPQP